MSSTDLGRNVNVDDLSDLDTETVPAAKRAKPKRSATRSRKATSVVEDADTSFSGVDQSQKRINPAVEKEYYILLEENDNIPPTGQFFGVNGKAYILKPGEPAWVPASILSVLNDAVMSVPQVNASHTVVNYRERLRFPYRMLSNEPKPATARA